LDTYLSTGVCGERVTLYGEVNDTINFDFDFRENKTNGVSSQNIFH